jgi:hypothetical protein
MNGLNEKSKRDGEMFLFGCMHVYGDETLLTEMRYELHAWILMEGRHATAGKALAKVLSMQQMKKTQVKASDANLNFKYPASQGNGTSSQGIHQLESLWYHHTCHRDTVISRLPSISMNPPVWTPTIAAGNTIAHAIHCGCVQPLACWDAVVVKEGEHLHLSKHHYSQSLAPT